MRNYQSAGNSVTVPAPTDVASGEPVLIDSLFGVASSDALTGESVVLSTVGVFTLPKRTADDFTLGKKVYWDNGASECTLTVSSNKLVGVAVVAAGAATTSVAVRLNGSF